MYIIDESKKEIERSLRTQKETAKIKPEDFGIKNYDFDSNGFLNVHQPVNLNGFKQTSLPFKFGKVDGGFYCANSKLTSLKGAPQKVDGDFYCTNAKLTSLKGAPKEVGGGFYCYDNKLTSLKGAPQKVGGDFNCAYNSKGFTREDVMKVCKVGGSIQVLRV